LPVLTSNGDKSTTAAGAKATANPATTTAPTTTVPRSLTARSCRALAPARAKARHAWRTYDKLDAGNFAEQRGEMVIALSSFVEAIEHARPLVPPAVAASLQTMHARAVTARADVGDASDFAHLRRKVVVPAVARYAAVVEKPYDVVRVCGFPQPLRIGPGA